MIYKKYFKFIPALLLTAQTALARPSSRLVFDSTFAQDGYRTIISTLLIIIAFLVILRSREKIIFKRLRLQNNQISIALDSAEMGLWEWNISTGTFNADDKCIKMLGYTKDEVPPNFIWWSEQTHRDDRKKAKESLMALFDAQTTNYRSEYRIQTKSGEWIWVLDRARIIKWSSDGKPVKAIGTHVNVTKRHKNENQLRQRATVIEQAAETIIITNKEGIIEYVNPSFETKMGYTKKEILGKSPHLFSSGKHNEQFYKNIYNDIEHGRTWRGLIINKCKNGSTIQLETSISPVSNDQDITTQYVAIGRDATHETLLEGQLRQAHKMEAIGTLAGGIAHDFNNILSAVIGYSELAMLDADPKSEISHNISEVIKAAKRAADLVAQILTFSRRTEQERKPLLLAPVIKEALKLLRGTLPSTIDIQQNISRKCEPVLADPTQMHQIIMNLCTNAYHAMREQGGTLDIRLDSIDLQKEKEAGQLILPPGKYAHLSISDTGYGIPENILEHIFEPYFTTKKGGDGTGLGLATVHGIVKLHDGAITVYSEEGEGTTFNIFLPVCEPEENTNQDEKSATPLPQGNGELVMVVDDEEAIVQMVEIALSHIGYEIDAYTSSVKALEAFETNPDNFACIITDQTMPNLTGVNLSKRILKISPQCPIILCSGFSETINSEKAKDIGIFQYIMKPTTSRVLAEAVHNAITKNTTNT